MDTAAGSASGVAQKNVPPPQWMPSLQGAQPAGRGAPDASRRQQAPQPPHQGAANAFTGSIGSFGAAAAMPPAAEQRLGPVGGGAIGARSGRGRGGQEKRGRGGRG